MPGLGKTQVALLEAILTNTFRKVSGLCTTVIVRHFAKKSIIKCHQTRKWWKYLTADSKTGCLVLWSLINHNLTCVSVHVVSMHNLRPCNCGMMYDGNYSLLTNHVVMYCILLILLQGGRTSWQWDQESEYRNREAIRTSNRKANRYSWKWHFSFITRSTVRRRATFDRRPAHTAACCQWWRGDHQQGNMELTGI